MYVQKIILVFDRWRKLVIGDRRSVFPVFTTTDY
jgi:hypothetical protein